MSEILVDGSTGAPPTNMRWRGSEERGVSSPNLVDHSVTDDLRAILGEFEEDSSTNPKVSDCRHLIGIPKPPLDGSQSRF